MATPRFADLSEDEMEEILNETESRKTKYVIQVASKLFEDYINNKPNLRSDDLHDCRCDRSNRYTCIKELKILELCNMLFDGAMSASHS